MMFITAFYTAHFTVYKICTNEPWTLKAHVTTDWYTFGFVYIKMSLMVSRSLKTEFYITSVYITAHLWAN